MPVAAKFIADFGSFTRQLDAAQLELRNFDKEIGKLDTSLGRFGDSFSGRKILTEANMATKAVMDFGGANLLTEREQARLNGTLVEAIAKYAALGKSAPQAMRDLERATRDAAESTQKASGWWGDLGKSILGTMAGFVSAQAILGTLRMAVGAIKDQLVDMTVGGAAVADVADNFDRMTQSAGLLGAELLGSLREGTHRTITDLDLMKTVNQGLAAGMVLTAESAGVLAKGAFALAQATGGDVKTAFDAMNEAMLTGRTRTLEAITGKIDLEQAEWNYATALGVTRKDLTETQQIEAKRVAILDSVRAALGRLGEQTDGLDEKVQQAQTAWRNFQDELGKAINRSPVLVAAIDEIGQIIAKTFGGDLDKVVQRVARLFDEALIAVVEFGRSAVSAAGFAAKEWYAAQKVFGNVVQVLEGVGLAALYAEKAQLSLGHMLGLNEARWKANDKAIEDTMIRMLRRGESLQQMTERQKEVDAATDAFDATLAKLKARMEAARVTTDGLREAVEQKTIAVIRSGAAVGDYIKQSIHAALTTERWMNATRALGEGMKSFNESAHVTADAVGEVADAFDAAADAAEKYEKKSAAAVESAAKSALAAGGWISGQYALSHKMSGAEQQARASAAGGVVALDSFGNPYIYIAGVNEAPRGQRIGARARGGPVSAGSPYLVGERGPELFVPNASGSIDAAGAWGGGVSITVHVDAREALFDSASGMNRLAERVGAALIAQMRGRGMAVAAVGG